MEIKKCGCIKFKFCSEAASILWMIKDKDDVSRQLIHLLSLSFISVSAPLLYTSTGGGMR